MYFIHSFLLYSTTVVFIVRIYSYSINLNSKNLINSLPLNLTQIQKRKCICL